MRSHRQGVPCCVPRKPGLENNRQSIAVTSPLPHPPRPLPLNCRLCSRHCYACLPDKDGVWEFVEPVDGAYAELYVCSPAGGRTTRGQP
jgi:hypothetical protein